MTVLAAPRRAIGAVLPLEKWHLFGKPADRASVAVQRLSEQRVARGAQLGLPDVKPFGGLHTCRGPHHVTSALIHLEGAEHQRRLARLRDIEDVAASEASWRAEPLAGDLVTDGARHTIGRKCVRDAATIARREMLEYASESAGRSGRVGRHRHVADGAFVFDSGRVLRVVDRLPPNGGQPIGIARGVRHHRGAPAHANGDVFTA